MWFLLIQIIVLLLLAAALGATLMWWWMRSRFQDVTDEHEQLLALRLDPSSKPATQQDVETAVSALTAPIQAIRPTDVQPLLERIMRLEQAIADLKFPAPDLGPLQERLAKVDARVAGLTFDPLMTKVSEVGSAIANMRGPDLRPIDERLSRLEGVLRGLQAPQVDLGPVHSGIASLGVAIGALEAPGKAVEPLAGRLAAMEARLSDMGGRLEGQRRNDTDSIISRVAQLSSTLANMRGPDLAPLHASIIDLERSVLALDKPPTDLAPIEARIAALEAAVQPIDRGLAGLQEAVANMPGPDFGPVIGAVRSIDSRHDLVAVENRLTAIEYGMAAVHHMLRSRSDQASARSDNSWDGRNGAAVHRDMPPAPARPPRDSDPINIARKPDDQANLLVEPAFGAPDDLELIDGVGPMLRALLHEIGIFYFWQVAEWTPEEVNWVESKLMHFRGRIRRDDWVGHARTLASAPTAAKRPMDSRPRGTF